MITNVQQGINYASSLSKGNIPNINSIKSMAEKSIIKNELQVEKQMLNSVLQSASMIKSITALTNPSTAPTEIIKTVYKAVNNLTQLFNSLSK